MYLYHHISEQELNELLNLVIKPVTVVPKPDVGYEISHPAVWHLPKVVIPKLNNLGIVTVRDLLRLTKQDVESFSDISKLGKKAISSMICQVKEYLDTKRREDVRLCSPYPDHKHEGLAVAIFFLLPEPWRQKISLIYYKFGEMTVWMKEIDLVLESMEGIYHVDRQLYVDEWFRLGNQRFLLLEEMVNLLPKDPAIYPWILPISLIVYGVVDYQVILDHMPYEIET